LRLTDNQVSAGMRYIKDWLYQEGYEAKKWNKTSQDGNWMLYAMTEADDARCDCCQEPILKNAPALLEAYCGWQQLHFEVLSYVMQKAAETD